MHTKVNAIEMINVTNLKDRCLFFFILSIHICLEKGIFVSVLKEHFDMFSKVKKVISDRILLALGVNPYQSYEKLNW